MVKAMNSVIANSPRNRYLLQDLIAFSKKIGDGIRASEVLDKLPPSAFNKPKSTTSGPTMLLPAITPSKPSKNTKGSDRCNGKMDSTPTTTEPALRLSVCDRGHMAFSLYVFK